MPDTAKATVVLVEDDDDVRLVTRRGLELAGWTVVEATTAAEAFPLVRQAVPDVVLLDLGLPDADGATLLARLKADPALARVPVVVMSGRSDAREVEALMLAGARDYLVKPVRSRDLVARLAAARLG